MLRENLTDIATLFQLILIGVISYFVYAVITIVIPPVNFPHNIPTIPFYVSFLGTYTTMDQETIYQKYLRSKLETFGAVKIYFASRWNILVSKPEYLLEVFKDENIYAKSGNQKKIPYSVLAQYTGDNIISAHGDNWKLYRKVLAPSIQFPNLDPVYKNSKTFVDVLDQELEQTNTIAVTDILQRLALQNVGQSILGIDLGTLEKKNSEVHNRVKNVKMHVFKAFYLNFPYFDQFPIPSRQSARIAVIEFRKYFCDMLKGTSETMTNLNSAGYRLAQHLNDESITDKQFADNAIITLVAGHENPLLLMLTLFFIIAKYETIQENIRAELRDDHKVESLSYLDSVMYEALRMYPPLGQIINRCTTKLVTLGSNISIPRGVYVGYNNLATGRDRGVWGADADKFRPERWGTNSTDIAAAYSRAKRNCSLPAFHGRKRACLGEKFALFEIKTLLTEVISKYKLRLDPKWDEKVTPAGPICPVNLKIEFTTITDESK